MFGAEKGTADKLDGKKLHIGIVQARFNESITNTLASACLAELKALGVQEKNITHVKVPGALEVPVALQAMAESDSFDASSHWAASSAARLITLSWWPTSLAPA